MLMEREKVASSVWLFRLNTSEQTTPGVYLEPHQPPPPPTPYIHTQEGKTVGAERGSRER